MQSLKSASISHSNLAEIHEILALISNPKEMKDALSELQKHYESIVEAQKELNLKKEFLDGLEKELETKKEFLNEKQKENQSKAEEIVLGLQKLNVKDAELHEKSKKLELQLLELIEQKNEFYKDLSIKENLINDKFKEADELKAQALVLKAKVDEKINQLKNFS